jgi:hypothetical protein
MAKRNGPPLIVEGNLILDVCRSALTKLGDWWRVLVYAVRHWHDPIEPIGWDRKQQYKRSGISFLLAVLLLLIMILVLQRYGSPK